MGWILVVCCFLTFALAFTALLQWGLAKRGMAVHEHAENLRHNKPVAAKPVWEWMKRTNGRIGRLGGRTKDGKLAHFLKASGVPIRPQEYIVMRVLSMLLTAGLLYLVFHHIPALVLGAVAGVCLPRWWVGRQRMKRIRKFNSKLPDFIVILIGSLKAGYSFMQALKSAEEEMDSPFKDEIRQVLKEMQYGSSLEEALADLLERMPNKDLELIIDAVVIQKQVGGNLVAILEIILQTVRDRMSAQQQIVTLTAQGRLSGIIIGLLPIGVGSLLHLIDPSYITTLFHSTLGLCLLAGGIVLELTGFLFIRKITRIEV
ncbi:type II secretion system F family protein [Paenibacillus sp.]|uniref:type II secretion system F family protein n=1 Tax=Paenibacillus sp. TaxID=58172 RepID=UPI002D6CFEC8|nr:type II secretion system F family protein [Paenibacillus sp.]HZG84283.1 type II secretion system F family protein [Paenibacillus sp.]